MSRMLCHAALIKGTTDLLMGTEAVCVQKEFAVSSVSLLGY